MSERDSNCDDSLPDEYDVLINVTYRGVACRSQIVPLAASRTSRMILTAYMKRSTTLSERREPTYPIDAGYRASARQLGKAFRDKVPWHLRSEMTP
jgi:hypothetical protein